MSPADYGRGPTFGLTTATVSAAYLDAPEGFYRDLMEGRLEDVACLMVLRQDADSVATLRPGARS
jgi:hypothetical protein